MTSMAKILGAAALVSLSLGAKLGEHSALTFDASAAKNRPVTKVMTLLKDMLKQLEKEAEDDEDIYDKLACWCETNDREKTKAIKDAESRIAQLQVQIEEDTAISARLNTEIKNTEEEVAKNQEALDEAIAIRKKELAEFNAEEKEMLEAIQALRAAVTVLSKHHGGAAFLQVPHTHMLGVATTLQHLIDSKHLVGVLTHKERRVASAFIQAPEDFFDASPTMADQSYTPQSGEIFGILTQMKETFEKDLSDAQKTEEQRVKAFEEIKKLKEDEIFAGQAQIEKKTEELADTDERLAHAKEDIEDTKASLTADEKFLMDLKEKCQMTDQEWEARQKTRAAEMEAVSKALAILSGDDAHDTFTRTFNPAFLQTRLHRNGDRRQAAELLAAKASKLHSPRLAALATSMKLDAFEKVKKAIDDLVKALQDEMAAEVKKRDWCIEEFDNNALETQQTEFVKKDVLAKIAALETTIKTLTAEIDTLKAEIAEMEKQLKAASEARDAQNKEFQATVADQQETQKLLKSALEVLAGFYGKGTTALVQNKQGPPPPPGFEEYKKSAASGGVMEMIEQIMLDAKKMEEETRRDEQEAQKAYEDFTKETKDSVAAKSAEIVTKSEEKAKAEGSLVEAKEEREAVLLELEQLSNYNAELHQSCDFTTKNFELRQTARAEEIEALRQAKAILSGSDFAVEA
jgi:hypothetical protein